MAKTQKKKTQNNTNNTKNTSKKKEPKPKKDEFFELDENALRKKREIQGLITIALGIFIAIAMFFHITGAVGEYVDRFMKGCFGHAAFVLPIYLVIYGGLMLAGRSKMLRGVSTLFFLILFLDIAVLNSVRFVDPTKAAVPLLGIPDLFKAGAELNNGGVFGMVLAGLLTKAIGKVGTYIAAVVIALISIIIVRDKPYSGMDRWKEKKAQRRESRRNRDDVKMIAAAEESVYEKQLEITAPQENRTSGQPTADQIAEMKRVKKALRKQNLDQNQANIMKYMLDDSLALGKDAPEQETGFGLDGSQKSLMQPAVPKKTEPSFLDKLEKEKGMKYSDEKMGISTDMAASDSPKVKPASSFRETGYDEPPQQEPATKIVSRNPVKNEEKITNSQAAAARLDQSDFNEEQKEIEYQFPPLTLLTKSEMKRADLADLAEKTRTLEQTLEAFHVDARVVDAVQGPAVTRYEIQPNTGVKVASIVRLADDIALNLRAKSLRIEAPIPGKAAVGIEIENDAINMVRLRELLEAPQFMQHKSRLAVAIGKDIAGNPIIGDIRKMPHLLIAGTTGSGKSVCVNSMILSILYHAKPEEVKLVLIDPKVVEMKEYNGIPHMLIPVVTEPTKAAAALNWAVAEMNDRYKKFAEAGVKDLASYNEHIAVMEEGSSPLPQIVIIIDELADLMMAAPSQVEESICRLAQLARAAGMHLVVATQRPSVDVITGLIKANIPSRIALTVSSQVDSRTILDMSGAEKLVGNGDMLYNPIGLGKPVRVQGCFVSEDEIHQVIEFVKNQYNDVEYAADVLHTIDKADAPAQAERDDDTDELLDECVELILQAQSASTSMLQRRFRIGYNRAARIMDQLEAKGFVGPQDGSRPRQVLITEEEYYGGEQTLIDVVMEEIEETEDEE